MNHINNDMDHILMRRSQNTLIVVGTGTILFSVWTVVKTLSSFVLLKDEVIASVRNTADDVGFILSEQQLFYIVLVIMLIFLILFLAVRIYIGMSAISEGRGLRKSKGYLILVVIVIIINITTVAISLFSAKSQESLGALSKDTSLSSLVIELTSIVMAVEMVFAAVRLRRARLRVSQSSVQKEQE